MIPQQQEISAQVWICHDCGGHDPKSCGCAGATAYSELAAKREQDQVRAKAYRERKAAASRDAPVEKIKETPSEATEAQFACALAPDRLDKTQAEITTDAATPEDFQKAIYNQACQLVYRMTRENLRRFRAHLRFYEGQRCWEPPSPDSYPGYRLLTLEEAEAEGLLASKPGDGTAAFNLMAPDEEAA